VLLTGDQTRNFIGNFGRTCYTDGPVNLCDQTRRGEWFGNFHVKTPEQLRAIHRTSGNASQFQVDDNGYMVPVGVGNNWTDGKAKNLWGTTVRIDNINYAWGRPILEIDTITGLNRRDLIADFLPAFRFGYGNTFRYKGFRLYTLFNGQLGGDIYNQVKQSLYATNDHPDVNQIGKPDSLRKNTTYYATGVAQGNTPWLADFVEDATFARLQELAVGYLFDSRRHPWIKKIGANRIQADIIGRNVLTLTRYSGLNVEGSTGALTRNDNTVYPLLTSWTTAFTITF